MAKPQRHLIIVHTPRQQDSADFDAVKGRMALLAPDIEVTIVSSREPNDPASLPDGPTLVFSPTELLRFKPRRGKIYCGRIYTKMNEITRLRTMGIPVPETVMVEQGIRLDPATWGPLTVLKPDRGWGGDGVRLARTEDVRWWPPAPPRHIPYLAQRFIPTGTYPEGYRVMTVFSRPVYGRFSRRTEPLPENLEAVADPTALKITSNVSDGAVVEQRTDPEAIALAVKTAAVFPEAPVLGIDVVRHQTTGKLYVLEVNPSGQVWHLSTELGKMEQREYGADYYRQFGAIGVIADALIDVTRREAK
jgi:hypothetical protein